MPNPQSSSLEQILQHRDLTMPEMFQLPDILQKIKMRLQLFVDFCLHNEEFLRSMINIGIKVPMHNNENMKKVAHVALEILTCDHDCIAELFIVDKKRQRIRLYSEDDEDIVSEIVKNEETGELTITDKKTESEFGFGAKYGNLMELLAYMQEKPQNIDENCLNYMAKAFNTVIRVKPAQTYQFLQQQPQYLSTLISLTHYPSISYTLSKLVSEQEGPETRPLKIEISDRLVGKLQDMVEDVRFRCVLEFVEEMFNKSKYRGEEKDEIKFICEPFVAEKVVRWFVDRLLGVPGEVEVANCVGYLGCVVKRMNVDEEKDPYNYYDESSTEPTMSFEVGPLYNCLPALLVLPIAHQPYASLVTYSFYELLLDMTKHSLFTQHHSSITYQHIVLLLKQFNRESAKSRNGMVKYQIVGLMEKLLEVLRKESAELRKEDEVAILAEVGQVEIGKGAEGQGFRNKVRALLNSITHHDCSDIRNKYDLQLSPNNYTETRSTPIPELAFIKSLPSQPTMAQNKQNSPQNEVEPPKPESAQQSKPQLNLSLLDTKIKSMKEKRKNQHKDEEAPKVESECAVIEGDRNQGSPYQKEFVEFYIQHLLIF